MLIFFIVTVTYTQTFNVSINQDIRLAVTKDITGKKPPTIDILLIGSIAFKLFNIDVDYEYAGLNPYFQRVSLGGGIHYRYKFLEIGQSINHGIIFRESSKMPSWGSRSSVSFIHKRFRIIGSIQGVQRTDQGDMVRWSGFIGVGYMFNK